MSVFKFARVFTIALIAVAAVSGVYAVDAKRQHANQIGFSLRWAHQMVAQTESLALAADARGEHDPLNWAARLLSQGTDSRIIFATKITVPTPVKEPETYFLEPSTGIFDYTKIFDPQAGTGIRIRLYTTRTGIFGAKTLWQHDLTIAALFLLFYGFLFVVSERAAGVRASQTLASDDPGEGPSVEVETSGASFHQFVSAWSEEAKASLAQLGTRIRDLVRNASEVAKTSREFKELMYALRLKIHGEIEKLHIASKKGDELTGLALRVEAALSRKTPLDPEAQSLLRDLLGAAIQRGEAAAKFETSLEPIATDADLVFQRLESVETAIQAFSAGIKHTTEGMLEQSRKLSHLKNQGA